MESIIVDVEAVERFRKELLDVAEDCEEQFKRTEAALEDAFSLGWRDVVFLRFKEGFDDDMRRILPLVADMKAFEDEVLGKYQEKVEIYLGLR